MQIKILSVNLFSWPVALPCDPGHIVQEESDRVIYLKTSPAGEDLLDALVLPQSLDGEADPGAQLGTAVPRHTSCYPSLSLN